MSSQILFYGGFPTFSIFKDDSWRSCHGEYARHLQHKPGLWDHGFRKNLIRCELSPATVPSMVASSRVPRNTMKPLTECFFCVAPWNEGSRCQRDIAYVVKVKLKLPGRSYCGSRMLSTCRFPSHGTIGGFPLQKRMRRWEKPMALVRTKLHDNFHLTFWFWEKNTSKWLFFLWQLLKTSVGENIVLIPTREWNLGETRLVGYCSQPNKQNTPIR